MRTLKRIPSAILWATILCAATVAAFVESGGTPTTPPAADLQVVAAVRSALAVGAGDALSAAMGDEAYATVAQEAANYAGEHDAQAAQGTSSAPTGEGDSPAVLTLAELAVQRDSARADLFQRLTDRLPAEPAYVAIEESGLAIVGASGPLLDTIRAALGDHAPDGVAPAVHAALFDRALANAALDPDLRLVDVSAAQREAIVAAQRTRDAVTLDARNWYQPQNTAAARETFEAELEGILTVGGWRALAVLGVSI